MSKSVISPATSTATSFSPVHRIDGDFRLGLMLTADHARRDMPANYGSLGLKESEFERHIAYDIGVEALTRALAARLKAPAVLAGFSRLLIDPNRGEDDPTLIMQLSDGVVITGNYPLSAQERETRLRQFYRPYHDAVTQMRTTVAAQSGHAPLIIAIHSFTPRWKNTERPWHIGLLWDRDDRAIAPLLKLLHAQNDLVVGDNEPYNGALRNDALFRHATAQGFANVLIEVRQDLIANAQGVHEWAKRLAPMLKEINALEAVHEVRYFGSRSDPEH
ncbi:N-formylglutamate amidohydrolase [Brucella sp. BE17]|uniref:N-formylglutamate amidohydrolase n=1 Tax=Brucella sp. BE17 TaxID=3142977 RepID=UPI0031BA0994